MVRSLYKSADMEEDLSITLEPMGRMWHMRGHFGVVGSLSLRSEQFLAVCELKFGPIDSNFWEHHF